LIIACIFTLPFNTVCVLRSLRVHVVILLLLLIFVLWLVEEGATSGFVVEELAWVLAFCRLTHLHEFVEALRDARGLSGVSVGVQRLEGNVLFGGHLGTVLLDALDRSVRVSHEL